MSSIASRTLLIAGLLLLFGAVGGPGLSWGQGESLGAETLESRCEAEVASTDQIERALRQEAQKGYDLTATPNQGRVMAAVLFSLAEQMREQDPDGRPFLIRQEELFPALLRVTGLSPEELPPSARKAKIHGVTLAVEHRTERTIRRVEEGPNPEQALSVRAAWPEARPASYAYEDTASVPDVQIRQERPVTYRLLKYPDLVAYDEMTGTEIQPTSGALGSLFSVIGMADLRATRHAIAEDGTQVTLARVNKLVTTEAVATVRPSGEATRGLPDGRPDLEALQARLEEDRSVTYAAAPPPVCPAGLQASE